MAKEVRERKKIKDGKKILTNDAEKEKKSDERQETYT